jgi:hypothetical protein
VRLTHRRCQTHHPPPQRIGSPEFGDFRVANWGLMNPGMSKDLEPGRFVILTIRYSTKKLIILKR